MESLHRLSTTGALVVCLIGSQLTATVFASEEDHTPAAPTSTFASSIQSASRTLASTDLRGSQPTVDFRVVDAAAFGDAGQYYGRRSSRGRRNGAAAAIVALGAVASITGGAILVYANRPECSTTRVASGCGYGTKVVGGAVLSAGLVGIVAGALAWR